MAKLLFDVCCAPCLLGQLENIENYEIIIYVNNSNITSFEEYQKRLNEIKKITAILNLKLVIDKYDPLEWKNYIKGLENEPENGLRCKKCLEYRAKKLIAYAINNKFNLITTALIGSRFKNVNYLNKYIQENKEKLRMIILPLENYKQSLIISKDLQIYRQKYCGCEYSKKQ